MTMVSNSTVLNILRQKCSLEVHYAEDKIPESPKAVVEEATAELVRTLLLVMVVILIFLADDQS